MNPTPVVRAKFRVTSIKRVSHNPDACAVEMTPVSADEVEENQRFHKYTPSGKLEMFIDNPAAAEKLVLGQAYYVDFTPAEG